MFYTLSELRDMEKEDVAIVMNNDNFSESEKVQKVTVIHRYINGLYHNTVQEIERLQEIVSNINISLTVRNLARSTISELIE